ncbi:MAG: BON domain-containing protein [Bacteroidota bacterium]
MAILGQLEGYEDVRATVSNGIVSLRGTVVDAGRIEELNALVARVEGVVAIENAVMESTDVVERLNPALDRMRQRVEQAVAFLPLVAVALSAAVLMWLFGFWLARRRWPW